MFKKALIAGALAAACLPGMAAEPAADAAAAPAAAAPAPTPEHTFTGNFGLFSQYIFRGLTQTDRKPAAQGGFDYAHSSGFYAGTWASNISWLKENASVNGGAAPNFITGTYQSGGSLEWDFYGGYKWNLPNDFVLDLGTLYYWYPGDISAPYNAATRAALGPTRPFGGAPKADTWEVYGAASWKWASAKFSYAVLDHTFGTLDSRGTWYLDLSANVPLGDYVKELTGWTFMLHGGWQKYRGTDVRNALFSRSGAGGPTAPYATTPDNDELLSYKDVKLGVSYALPKDFTVGAYYTKAFSYNKLGYGSVNNGITPGFFGPYPHDIAKGTGTLYVQKTF